MVLLTLLWCTTASPLNTLKGRIPQWKVQEVVDDTREVEDLRRPRHQAEAERRRGHRSGQREGRGRRRAGHQGVDADRRVHAQRQPFAKFGDVTKYQILADLGDRRQQPAVLEGRVHAHARSTRWCSSARSTEVEQPFGLPPLPPECDTDDGAVTGYVVLSRDLGSLRVPAFVAFFMSLILFVLGLLGLHWREKDQHGRRGRRRPAAGPVAVPDPDEPELTKV